MNFIGIIPSRYASTRFPGKPLIDIRGKSMIQRVYERSSQSPILSHVYVATDDARIEAHVKAFGGKVLMTSSHHQSGTDRCYEAASLIAGIDHENTVIVNIQGDEPFIAPEQINTLCECFDDEKVSIATLVKKINNLSTIHNPNTPKVVRNTQGDAIYFSRSPIPYLRDTAAEDWYIKHDFYKHIGIYAYRLTTLKELTDLERSPLEIAESLEQLRWIENHYKIRTAITEHESMAIDSPDDLKKLLAQL